MASKEKDSTATVTQQSKNQQTIREICDQILAGQSIGIFTYPKIKRLLEDESLRELACSKLNLGLELQYSDDDTLQDIQLRRSEYKGYLNLDESIPKNVVWSVLMGHWDGEIPHAVLHEIRHIETWVLMLLSSPVPVPGKTKVVLELLPPDLLGMMGFALPDHTRFSLVDFPLHLPIELLEVDTAVLLLEAIMLEHKAILQARNYNAVSKCVMALAALMYPLESMFPVIPLLPVQMGSAEQLLHAPTPFIMGLPASFFMVKGIDLPSDVVLVDLDTNELKVLDDLHIPHFPEPEATSLKDAFQRALGKTVSVQELDPTKAADGFTSATTIDGDEIDVAVLVAMIRFFNSPNVFANFSKHTQTLRLYPRPVVALQNESFLRSRPQQSAFISEWCKTQVVEYFAECSLSPRNETYVRVQTGITAARQIGEKPSGSPPSAQPPDSSAPAERATYYLRNGTTVAEALLRPYCSTNDVQQR